MNRYCPFLRIGRPGHRDLWLFRVQLAGPVDQVITGLNQPVRLVAPEGDSRLFVVERNWPDPHFRPAGRRNGHLPRHQRPDHDLQRARVAGAGLRP